jgi:hypothetical protein
LPESAFALVGWYRYSDLYIDDDDMGSGFDKAQDTFHSSLKEKPEYG